MRLPFQIFFLEIPLLRVPLLVAAAGGMSWQAGVKDAPPRAEPLNAVSGHHIVMRIGVPSQEILLYCYILGKT